MRKKHLELDLIIFNFTVEALVIWYSLFYFFFFFQVNAFLPAPLKFYFLNVVITELIYFYAFVLC